MAATGTRSGRIPSQGDFMRSGLAGVVWVCGVLGFLPVAVAFATQCDGGGDALIVLTRKNDSIEQYRNRATMLGLPFVVDQGHDAPDPVTKDGDLHVAWRSAVVRMPIVAGIKSAKLKRSLVAMFKCAGRVGST